jgi:hypothetical protein
MTDPTWISDEGVPTLAPQVVERKLTQRRRPAPLARSRNEQRCPMSDLLLGQCACLTCRPDLAHVVMDMAPVVRHGSGRQLDEPDDRTPRRYEITLRTDREQHCKGCEDVIPPGSRAVFDAGLRAVLCLGCAANE